MRSTSAVALAAVLGLGTAGCTAATPGPAASAVVSDLPVVASTPAAAPTTAAPSSASLSSAVALGSPLRIQGGDRDVLVTLARTDHSRPDAPRPMGDSYHVDLTVDVRAGSFGFAPDRLTYFGSRDQTRQTLRLLRGDAGRSTVAAGEQKQWRLAYGMPAAGPNGDLMFALYDQSGAVLGYWRG